MRNFYTTAILAVTTVVALATPAKAQDPGGQPDWIEQARLVAVKDGITVGEAVRRARLLEKVRRANERFFNDPDYAGAVIVQDGRSLRARFLFKNGKQPDLGDQELRDISDIAPAQRSFADFRKARETLLEQLAPSGASGTFTEDVQSQRMKFYPDDPDRFRQVVAENRIVVPDFIEVQTASARPTLQYDVYGSGSIDYSASTDNCTGGFNVTNGTVRGLSTAGHCAIPPLPSTHRGQPIGTLQAGISQLYDGYGLDVSWFRNSANLYPNRVRITSTTFYSVTSAVAAPSPIYDTTCVLPRAAAQQCTTVREYVYYPKKGMASTDRSDGPYVATEAYVTADKDSGAPWIYANVAQGIHLGSVVLGGSARSLFSPVSSLPKIGLRVVTTP